MKNYRFVEDAPEDGKRHGKKSRRTLFIGPDKAALKAAIDAYHADGQKRAWAETSYYHGTKLIYAYEL